LHRTSSIKLNFGGPVIVDDVAGAVTVGTTEQHVSNPDVVYYRNNKAASSDRFMMIVEPRSTGSDGDLEVTGALLVSGSDGFGSKERCGPKAGGGERGAGVRGRSRRIGACCVLRGGDGGV